MGICQRGVSFYFVERREEKSNLQSYESATRFISVQNFWCQIQREYLTMKFAVNSFLMFEKKIILGTFILKKYTQTKQNYDRCCARRFPWSI